MSLQARALILLVAVLTATALAAPVGFAAGSETPAAERPIPGRAVGDHLPGAAGAGAAGDWAAPVTALAVTAVLAAMGYGVVRRWFPEPKGGRDEDRLEA